MRYFSIVNIKKGILSICAFLGIISVCFGQDSFSDQWNSRLKKTQSYWMIDSLHSRHADIFSQDHCPPEFETSELSSGNNFLDEVQVKEEIAKDVQSKLLRENCDRFLELNAIADLVFPLADSLLQSNGLAENFKYLAVLESGLNPNFDQEGNIGLWGMNLIDAQRFGIESIDSVDFRYNLNISTLSFIKKIKHLSQQFENEALVLMAYHEGIKPVKHRWAQWNGDMAVFIARSPEETVEWLMYLKSVVEYFSFLKIPDLSAEMTEIEKALVPISPKKKSPISSYSKVLGVDESVLHAWNPQFVQDLAIQNDVMPLRISQQLLPKFMMLEDSIHNYAARILELERIAAEKAAEEQARIRAQEEIIHTVRSGEVLGVIASRYGVSVRELKEWNSLRKDLIYVGQKLSIYGKAAPPKKVEEVMNTNQDNGERTPDGKAIIYTVKSGDNLWDIAKKYPGVSADDIMQWNEITDDLKPGQELVIYQ